MASFQTIKSKSEFRVSVQNGISIYEKEEIRIEFLTLSRSTKDNTPIMDYFEKLIPTLLYKGRWGVVDYCGICVDNQHLHILIRKPYVLINVLRENWQRITGLESNISIRTIKHDIEGQYLIDTAFSYMLKHDEHDNRPIIYIQSSSWGIVLKKKKSEKQVTVKRLKDRQKFKYEESYMIGDRFVTVKEYEEHMKQNTIKQE